MRPPLRSFFVAASYLLALGCGDSQDQPSSGAAAAGAGGRAVAGAGSSQAGGGVGGSVGGSAAGSAAGGSAGAPSGAGGADASGAAGTGGVAGSSGAAGTAGAVGIGPVDYDAQAVIVVLGSSTAAGSGPTEPQNAWVQRYGAYLAKEFVNFQLINLAVGGYTTYHEQPDNFVPPQGRPTPDKAHNITMALSKNPDAILINLPGNDTANNVTFQEQMDNFARMTNLAGQAGVQVWVATTQPRNFGEQAQRMLQMQVRDAVTTKYAEHALDFWTPFAETDGKIKALYDSGDGIHMNDAAHALLAEEVIAAKIPEAILGQR